MLEFQKCLDRTDPVPFSTIRGIMQQELRGRSIESVFSYIDPQPLASASVAQVRTAAAQTSRPQKYTQENTLLELQSNRL